MMGVSTSMGILTMVDRQDKLSCVNDSCLSTASSWLPSGSLYKENIRMDQFVMGVSTSMGILTMVVETGQPELC